MPKTNQFKKLHQTEKLKIIWNLYQSALPILEANQSIEALVFEYFPNSTTGFREIVIEKVCRLYQLYKVEQSETFRQQPILNKRAFPSCE